MDFVQVADRRPEAAFQSKFVTKQNLSARQNLSKAT
jgi:hypothetical protein